MRVRSLGILSIAHASADVNQGAIPVLLPFFIAAHHLSYTAAAAIVFAVSLVSSAFQPVFGWISDRRPMPWLIPLSMLLLGVGVSSTGLLPSYRLGVAAVMISGLGSAMFHPEGARLMLHLAHDRKATAMSLFGMGGQAGFAVGPIIGTAALLTWGLKGTACLIVPPLLVAVPLVFMLPGLTRGYGVKGKAEGGTTGAEGPDRWPSFVCLSSGLLVRSMLFYGLNTFLPLFYVNVLHASKATPGSALAVFLVACIAGNFAGGWSADRLGYRAVAIWGCVLLAVILPFLLAASRPLTATLILAAAGLALSVPLSSMVVLGQSYLPGRIGLASGITLGLAFSFGGLTTPAFGWIADRHGLRATLTVLAFLPVAMTILMLMLPSEKRAKEATARETGPGQRAS